MFSLWKTLGAAVVSAACVAAAHGLGEEPADAPPPPPPAQPAEPAPAGPEKVKPPPAVEEKSDRALPGHSQTFLRSVGNGLGNTVIIENGGGGSSTTVLENARNGVGNRVVIVDGQVVTDLQGPVLPRGPGLKFGEVNFYSPQHGCRLYWCPRTLTWYRYDSDRADYVPARWDF
jgi:hypothetical protein